MAVEIERKFLVNPELWSALEKPEGLFCSQTYLHKDIDKTVRVRILGKKGFVTIKGPQTGISKPEYEYEIPLLDAQEMIELFGGSGIEKTRYLFPLGKHTWEVDVFHKTNEGLIVAEIELSEEQEVFDQPEWLGVEVTHDERYKNSNLQSHPFQEWELH